MYAMLQHAHSGWRYLLLLLIAITWVRYLVGVTTKGKWLALDSRLMLITMIALDIQILLGVVLFISGHWWRAPLYMEHATTMVLGAAALHVGKVLAVKASQDSAKLKRALVGVSICAILLSLGVWRVTIGM